MGGKIGTGGTMRSQHPKLILAYTAFLVAGTGCICDGHWGINLKIMCGGEHREKKIHRWTLQATVGNPV